MSVHYSERGASGCIGCAAAAALASERAAGTPGCSCDGLRDAPGKRTDSVEQVMCEMLRCIARLTEVDGGCKGCADSGTPECEHVGSSKPCYVVFSDRLRVLGVKP